jgi:diguanylate cyclase (GGDEF)-like protein/PAS domain S-box-containing protein
VNDALCSITRTPRDELLGVALADLTYPDDLAEYARGMRDLTDGRITRFECEQRMLDADGEIVWIGLTTSLVRDAHGRPLYRIAQLQDVSQRKRFEGQLQHLADHDPLTGLFNRRRFDEELARELSAARRYGSGGAVLALDLDNFKYVNDSLGHAAGDELITSVGQALRRRLRGSDTLGRLGGDEFALVLPHVDRATAESVAQDILEAVSRECRVATTKGARRVSVSIGVACFDTEPKRMTSEELLVEADIAMYDAKEAGRDCYRVFSPEAGRQERMEARLTWVERIRKALEEERFVLHAQPIVALNGTDGGPREELLLRMVDEDGDLVPPGVFLYIAESYDLVQEIDRWVVREAIRLLAREASAGRPVTFEVNLSAKSITDPELPTYVGRQLAAAGVDPQRLVFEVTETAAIVNIDRAKLFAKELGELGCGFALDDFGAGFASFYYLKHLVFDYIKIDGEFIEGLAGNRTDQLVVRSLVEIARGLGKQTIAEFVGDAETLELVRTHGVDFAQGFHLGKPGPVGARASLEGEVPSPPPALARRGGR